LPIPPKLAHRSTLLSPRMVGAAFSTNVYKCVCKQVADDSRKDGLTGSSSRALAIDLATTAICQGSLDEVIEPCLESREAANEMI
jgi:hypothetical protein